MEIIELNTKNYSNFFLCDFKVKNFLKKNLT